MKPVVLYLGVKDNRAECLFGNFKTTIKRQKDLDKLIYEIIGFNHLKKQRIDLKIKEECFKKLNFQAAKEIEPFRYELTNFAIKTMNEIFSIRKTFIPVDMDIDSVRKTNKCPNCNWDVYLGYLVSIL